MARSWQDQVEIVTEVGVGDSRTPVPGSVWGQALWGAGSQWQGLEPLWTDVPCTTVLSASSQRGRTDPWEPYGPGTAQVQVLNNDGRFSFQPYDQLDYQTIRPGSPLRIGAVHQGRTHWLYRGYLLRIADSISYYGSEAALEAQDNLANLHRIERPGVPPVGANELTGARVNRLLDEASFPAEWRRVSPGHNQLQATVLDQAIGDELELVAFAEGGAVFCDPEGNVVFKGREWLWSEPTAINVQGFIGPDENLCPSSYEVSWASDDVINEVSLQAVNGVAQTEVDSDSVRQLGYLTYERTDLPNANDQDVWHLARLLLAERSRLTLRIRSITLTPAVLQSAWEFCLSVDIGWRLQVTYRHPTQGWEWTALVHVQGVSHSITPDEWLVTLAVDEVYPFTLEAARWAYSRWDIGLWSSEGTTELEGVS